MNRPTSRGFLREHSLSLVFFVLLGACLAGQSFWGLAGYNTDARTAHLQEISWWRYVTSSSFAVDVAENWQSEFLQFTVYVLFTVWLVDRGSSESKKLTEVGRQSDAQQQLGAYATADSPRWARLGGGRTRLYSHSLSLVMLLVFLTSWAAQLMAGHVAYNEERLRDLLLPLSLGEYAISADFWGRTLQNWQSELLAVGTMSAFSIYLRERGSPESKPVGAPHDSTGSDG